MAIIVFKSREVEKMHPEELQSKLKDQVFKQKVFSWMFIKE
jgi:hypothetical protein